MLIAVDQNGKEIMAHNKTQIQLESMRHKPLYCPECRQKVILKAGQVTIPHFAHHHKYSCTNSQSESEEHLKGKLHFYQWARQQGFPAKIEHSLSSINQRLDVIFKANNKWYAIEYQCSPINPSELMSRTLGIASRNIFPIWVFGQKYYHSNKHTFNLNSTLRSSIIYSAKSNQTKLLFYNSIKRELMVASDIYSNKNKAFCNILHRPLSLVEWKDWFQFRPISSSYLYHKWINEKKYFRIGQKKFITQQERDYLNDLYYRSLHPQYLPSCVHLPVRNTHRYSTPNYVWQTFIVLHLDHLSIGELTTYNKVYHSVKKYFSLPSQSIYPGEVRHPVMYYLQVLSQLGYLKRVSSNSFVKLCNFNFPTTLDEALAEDRKILQKLLKF